MKLLWGGLFFMALSSVNRLSATGTADAMYEKIRQMSKAELHLHLGGSYPIEYLRTIATPEQFAALQAGIDQLAGGIEYQKAFFVFGLVSQIVNSLEKVEQGTFALCRALQADGVAYVEIRTGLKDFGSGYEADLKAVLHGIERAQQPDFKARVLLSVQRSSTPEHANATVDLAIKYRNHGVVGIDISGDSTIGDITPILPIILRAKKHGLAIALHIGESPLEKDQLLLLQTLKPDRIGHGVHLTPKAYAWIRAHKTPVEVCLTSSELAMMVDHHASHPGIEYYKNNHPIVICTDDPLIFRITLTQELLKLLNSGTLEFKDIEKIVRDSWRYAFL
jgi:adenosine deaminase